MQDAYVHVHGRSTLDTATGLGAELSVGYKGVHSSPWGAHAAHAPLLVMDGVRAVVVLGLG